MPSAERPDFTISRRGGYEIDEVDRYLDDAEQRWQSQLAAAREQIDRLRTDLDSAKMSEEAIHLTLVAATKTKEEMVGAAQRALAEATGSARLEAEKITAEAQYEAFQLVNDARGQAETILAPARSEAAKVLDEAKREAEVTLSEARREAIAIITEIKNEGQRLIAGREADLQAMSERFEENNSLLMRKVAVLQAVTADMEARLQAIAHGSLEELIGIAALITAEIDPANGVKLSRQQGVRSGSPAVTTIRSQTDDDEKVPEGRGSYYSRHSAKLPRLGAESTGNTFAALNALRERTFANSSHDDDDGTDDEADEETRELIRTA